MWSFRKIKTSDVHEVVLYREAMLLAKSSMDGTNGLSSKKYPKQYIELCIENEKGNHVSHYLVSSTQFVCVDENDKILGMCNVRHHLNDLLMNVGGHIGYSVHPEYRRKGIASFMLLEALKYCESLNMSKVLVTCLKSNEASRKTILKCGGIFEDLRYIHNEEIERYWIYL